MTKKQQRIFIAETDGWKDVEFGVGPNRNLCLGDKPEFSGLNKIVSYTVDKVVPDYLKDRDAIIDVVLRRMKNKQVDFIENLRVVTEYKKNLKTVHWFAVVTASPEDLCRAFIVTHTGKWF